MKKLRILHLEDDPMDAELVEGELEIGKIDSELLLVSTREDFAARLDEGGFDLILADYSLPAFDGMSALIMVREKFPDLPFIFVSGKLGEESAIESLKSGATDYVLKSRLSRLVPAVLRALTEAEERAERRKAEEELVDAYAEIHDRAENYKSLFNSIRDVIFVTDPLRVVLHVNQPALRENFGYELEEVVGKRASVFYADREDYLRTGREFYNLEGPVKSEIRELRFKRKNGEIFTGELYATKRVTSSGYTTGNIGIIRDISERKKAEEALRESEMRRYQLQMELKYAAEIQAKLLPRSYPTIPGFELAAKCIPAHQVWGDFIDWHEAAPGIWSLTLGDVMGKGMAAAILMATVRAAIRSVTLHNNPGRALQLADRALLPDLENSESFVTLFHAQLDAASRSLIFTDCGHGLAFLRLQNGAVVDLIPRGLPFGVQPLNAYEEGAISFKAGDALVVYSDGLIDARPDLKLDNFLLAGMLDSATTAGEMVDRLMELTENQGALPDDVTVLIVRCQGST